MPRRGRPPFDPATLEEAALRYVGRFSTSRSKLSTYLRRKVQERGWGGSGEPPIEQLVERFVRSGYVNDGAYALAKARTLTARGYGPARVKLSLRAAGIDEHNSIDALSEARQQALDAALRYAARRRLGPFASSQPDSAARSKALAAMLRAGHSFEIARSIIDLPPGSEIDPEEFAHLRLNVDLPTL